MWDNYGKRRQSIVSLLSIGGGILAVCLVVCIILVTSLQKTYQSDVAKDFHEHHIYTVEALEETIGDIDTMLKMVAVEISATDNANNYSNILAQNNECCKYSELYFMDSNHIIYSTSTRGMISSFPEIWQNIVVNLPSGEEPVCFLAQKENEEGELLPCTVTIYPIREANRNLGNVVAITDMNQMLERSAFRLQSELGEFYLVGEGNEILARSLNIHVIAPEETNFSNGIIAYARKESEAKKLLQGIDAALKQKEGGYVSLRTFENNNLQISYAPVECYDGVYLVSCYNDNIIQDEAQPLIFRCVVSCIIIVVLMIIIILYVWGSAKKANITIEKLAYQDPVTKGRNINYFKEFAQKVMGIFKETPFVIYRFDIANFRYINEAYGHKKADSVLISCVKRFEEAFTDKELCVRMNADQFLAIINNDHSVNQRLVQFRKMVNEDARSIGIKYPIRFKTGIYQIKKHDKDIDVMIDHANVARKTLTGDEKEMTALYSEKIVTNMHKIDRIESDMQRALATGEFKVYLQPKWDAYLDCITGAEALVRWIRNDGTMVYPNEFIPVFENNGFVEKLDFYMLESVCSMMREMIDEGREVYPISVNQSRLLLHSPDYVANVQKILQNYEIPKNAIELEITETVFLDDRDNMIETMKRLKDIGVLLAMDDFGSGYSSLNMLKDVPFDIIKIDREFFSESASDASRKWILQKVIEMILGLNMDVVCEGVENAEQVEFLKEIRCRKIQGYYYSKPIPANEYIEKYCRIYS
ncbi:MAG: EAL domain-containing protein [Lachnospiraceae bacterium]